MKENLQTPNRNKLINIINLLPKENFHTKNKCLAYRVELTLLGYFNKLTIRFRKNC